GTLCNVRLFPLSQQETSEKYDYYRDRVALACQWQSDLQGYCKKLALIEANMETHRRIQEEIKEAEDQLASGNAELKAVSNEIAQMKRTILLKKEKLAKLDIKSKKKHEEFERQKQEILESCSHIQEKRQAVNARVAAINIEIQQTINQKDKLLSTCEAQKTQCEEVIAAFRVALEKYHESLLKVSERSADRRRDKIAELDHRMNRC
ncbi:kinetochore protein Nuf2-B-like, partial [Bombina bombina]|uniref:kinetochore protein Nuf2-B-like n=1 Tax=Bombina bombina TaxID=8345 RepID=UPI00235AEBCD